MPNRQVRLADDVASFVEQRQEADGGSLSAATNRILREYIDNGTATKAAKAEVAVIGPPSRRRTIKASNGLALPPGTGPKGGKCPHPILRRIGDLCAACGSTI